MFGYTREHARAYFFSLMKSKGKVRVSGFAQNPV